MVFADLQPLHVHGEAGPQPRTGAPVCRGALSHELRQSGSSLYTRRRRAAAVANTSPRWLRCLAASPGPTGTLQAAICFFCLDTAATRLYPLALRVALPI